MAEGAWGRVGFVKVSCGVEGGFLGEGVWGSFQREVGERSDEGMMLYQCLYVHSLDLTYIQHTSSLIETLPLSEPNRTSPEQLSPVSNFSQSIFSAD